MDTSSYIALCKRSRPSSNRRDKQMQIHRRHFATLDSTNTWAKQHAEELDREALTLVTADNQTAGRGRFKRLWLSPAGQNIYATFCFFIEKHRGDIGNLPQVMAIAAADILEELGFQPQLKWPNDVMLKGKKTAGILCETIPISDQLCVVLGIGLNVNMPTELLSTIDRPATSLFAEDGATRDVEEVLARLQDRFNGRLMVFLDEGFLPFLEYYKKWLIHANGDLIRFHDNRTIWEGRFAGINLDGTLLLKLSSGEERTFIAGEIL
ncbi:MAG: biotin--[acetyl-CoA-carboxylase] ligase [Parachlamydia sp.]|nr:biotin--[acetyl-CoA-carboxylase] ligase [Parachlamydia sp.]